MLDEFFAADGATLIADRLLSTFDEPGMPRRHPLIATEAMLRMHRQDRLFSVIPLQLVTRGC